MNKISLICLVIFVWINGFLVGLFQHKLDVLRVKLKESQDQQPQDSFVTSSNTQLINSNMVNQESSAIVEPKSPALVAWEEEERIRKIASLGIGRQ